MYRLRFNIFGNNGGGGGTAGWVMLFNSLTGAVSFTEPNALPTTPAAASTTAGTAGSSGTTVSVNL